MEQWSVLCTFFALVEKLKPWTTPLRYMFFENNPTNSEKRERENTWELLRYITIKHSLEEFAYIYWKLLVTMRVCRIFTEEQNIMQYIICQVLYYVYRQPLIYSELIFVDFETVII